MLVATKVHENMHNSNSNNDNCQGIAIHSAKSFVQYELLKKPGKYLNEELINYDEEHVAKENGIYLNMGVTTYSSIYQLCDFSRPKSNSNIVLTGISYLSNAQKM